MADRQIEVLLTAVEQAFRRRAWHGPNLRNSLRGVTPAVAAWRPQQERHNIWELAVHAAYWKYRILRQLSDEMPAFDEAGSNFFIRPSPASRATASAWSADRKRLDAWHERLVEGVRAFDPARLDDQAYNRYSYRDLILGAAAHDVYHAGQVRLLRTMWQER